MKCRYCMRLKFRVVRGETGSIKSETKEKRDELYKISFEDTQLDPI